MLSAPYDVSQRFLHENKLSDKNLRLTSNPLQGYTSCHGKNNDFLRNLKNILYYLTPSQPHSALDAVIGRANALRLPEQEPPSRKAILQGDSGSEAGMREASLIV